MIFGPVPVARAAGAILAHATMMRGPDGAAQKIAKGTCLTADHIAGLAAFGHAEIIVARLEAGDIEENSAAMRLARALVPDPEAAGLRVTGAGAGRVNLYATGPGVVLLESDAIERLNAVDPMITFATLAPHMRVDPGTMVGTIKIIAYAVPEAALAEAEAAASGAISVQGPVIGQVTLIETYVDDPDMPQKGRKVTAERLSRFGADLSPRVLALHRAAPLSEAIAAAPGEMVLILTASATSDAHDVAPTALRQAGGDVIHYGMPVDPGNLLFVGRHGARPVIGLPGCARSPALNGADWVLERLICGLDVGPRDIQAMGVGGLLKEIPSRPRPRNLKEM